MNIFPVKKSSLSSIIHRLLFQIYKDLLRTPICFTFTRNWSNETGFGLGLVVFGLGLIG